MAINKIKTGSIQDNTVTGDDIQDGAITNAKVNACAAIAQSKVSGLATSISNLCSSISSVSSSIGQQANNIGLLGFKMAVNDGLTVFNLVDGVVDEFNDETGTDESEGSNDIYNAANDFYINNTSPTATPLPGGPSYTCSPTTYGFGMNSVTDPSTSTVSNRTTGTFTVPACTTAIDAFLIGGAGDAYSPTGFPNNGGGGGFVGGQLAVTPGQVLGVVVAEGGSGTQGGDTGSFGEAGGQGGPQGGTGGGGASVILSSNQPTGGYSAPQAPNIILLAGGGGGAASNQHGGGVGGGGGGLTGRNGRSGNLTTDGCSSGTTHHRSGGGGDQEQGGQAAGTGQNGTFFEGGNAAANDNGSGGGGAGYYGGGGGGESPTDDSSAGGGGSSYYGHPQVSLGITVAGTQGPCGAAWSSNNMPSSRTADNSQPDDPGTSPQYPQISPLNDIAVAFACAADIGGLPVAPQYGYSGVNSGDGYVLFRARTCAAVQNTTIVSAAFTSNSVATSARIVVFEEDVETPTLNTDVIASVSRDGGSNYTNATLSDSGYVTGTSGQRILTGQADISGQPSGQSMRWKLALANNTVKIHGVALQWS